MTLIRASFCFICAFVTVFNGSALACPIVGGSYLDTNCDGKLKIVTLGDSITFGRRDEGVLNISGEVIHFSDFGGYPIRLQKYLEDYPEVQILQRAKPGSDCTQTLARFKSLIKKREGKFLDLALVDCGINDFYTTHNSDLTKEIIFNILTFAKRNGIKAYVANLIPTARDFQQTWQETLNTKMGSLVSLDFSSMPAEILATDGVHPGPSGHQFLFGIVKEHFESTFGNPSNHTAILKSIGLTADTDGDGLADKTEKKKYRTNPKNPDSDGDGFTDLEEALAGTDPLEGNGP